MTDQFVVSATLEEQGDEFAEELIDLKRQPRKSITILGSNTLVRSLLHQGLLDELRLIVHPVVSTVRECVRSTPRRDRTGKEKDEAPLSRFLPVSFALHNL